MKDVRRNTHLLLLTLLLVALFVAARRSGVAESQEVNPASIGLDMSWSQFGRDSSRNPVSPAKNPPQNWRVPSRKSKTEQSVLWSAQLGTNTMGDPVVADGLVWVGTNEYANNRTDAAVLLCVSEKSGKPLYRYVSPRLPNRYLDWPYSSLGCSPLIEGDRLWFTTNRCELVCLNIAPLKANGGEPKMLWKVDMIKEFGVVLRGGDMGVVHIPSVASHGKFIYAVTGHGIDVSEDRVTVPTAPSLVCLEKETGKLVWKDSSPGANIIEGQWSSPTICSVKDQTQIVVAQGDGWIRAFEPDGDGNGSSRVIWELDINSKTSRFIFRGNQGDRRYFVGSPVFHDGHVYVGSGVSPALGRPGGRLVCIDLTRRGDISEHLAVDADGKMIPHRRLQAADPETGERVIANPNSGVKWAFNHDKDDYEKGFNGIVSRVAVHDGLVIASDMDGFLHCLDADTGKRYWSHDFLAAAYASPLVIDGKVYVADEDGAVTIFRLSKRKRQIAEIDMLDAIYCSPVFANGVLYVATRGRLYAIGGNRPIDSLNGNKTVGLGDKIRTPNAGFAPTPNDVVQKMLELASVKKSDTVCDLGSGDGRIVIAAAKSIGCCAIGYELNADLVDSSRKRAMEQNLTALTTFERRDIFKVDLSRVTVATLYLLPRQNAALIPSLNTMKPGSRVVTHEYPIPGVKPETRVSVESRESKESHTLFLYSTPITVLNNSR